MRLSNEYICLLVVKSLSIRVTYRTLVFYMLWNIIYDLYYSLIRIKCNSRVLMKHVQDLTRLYLQLRFYIPLRFGILFLGLRKTLLLLLQLTLVHFRRNDNHRKRISGRQPTVSHAF